MNRSLEITITLEIVVAIVAMIGICVIIALLYYNGVAI
jgi:hypothetical protein